MLAAERQWALSRWWGCWPGRAAVQLFCSLLLAFPSQGWSFQGFQSPDGLLHWSSGTLASLLPAVALLVLLHINLHNALVPQGCAGVPKGPQHLCTMGCEQTLAALLPLTMGLLSVPALL
jgi:hypothetical protein